MSVLRQAYWFVQGFIAKYKKTILSSFLLAVGVAVLFFLLLPKLPRPKRHLYVGIVGKHTLSQIPVEIERKLGIGLTKTGENLQPEPGLASRFEILDEGRIYRFYLRDSLKWSDGQEMRLADLEFVIPGVEMMKIEPNTIEFRLPEAFAPFPSVLSKPVVNGTRTSGEYEIKNIQAAGPYIDLVELESEREKLSYRFYDSSSQAELAFKLGQIDVLSELLARPVEADWPNVELKEILRTDLFVAVFYNTSNSLLADKSLRQGLSYAIKDKEIGQLRALSSYDPKSWVYNKTVKAYDYSEARAKELVQKAQPNGQETIELATTPELLFVAERIKSDWEKVGIKVEIRVVSSQPESFQAIVKMVNIPADPDQYSYWHSTQNTNFTRLQNAKVDKLLEDGRLSMRLEERRAIYHDLQRFLVEEAPATFLYHPTMYTITRKSKIEGGVN